MNHYSTPLPIDPRAYARGLACVHCGLCLPACPTYAIDFNEADSPRGRIQLMLGLADGKIAPTRSVRKHLDLCLDCRACETACPSDVIYHELLEETRAQLGGESSLRARIIHLLISFALARPTLLRSLVFFSRVVPRSVSRKLGMIRRSEKWFPRALPKQIFTTEKRSPVPAIVLFVGCTGEAFYGEVNRKAIDLLRAGGANVVIVGPQVCCGAIDQHAGFAERAQTRARRTLDIFSDIFCDRIVTTIAGCGAMLRDYPFILRDDPAYLSRAQIFAAKVCDISEALIELELPSPRFAIEKAVTYHDACHLAHGQRVTTSPRDLLARISGLVLVDLPESEMCCGAAGTYNLTHPKMSAALAKKKLQNIRSSGASVCAVGNVGCEMHLRGSADPDSQIEFVHPIELLHESIFGKAQI